MDRKTNKMAYLITQKALLRHIMDDKLLYEGKVDEGVRDRFLVIQGELEKIKLEMV